MLADRSRNSHHQKNGRVPVSTRPLLLRGSALAVFGFLFVLFVSKQAEFVAVVSQSAAEISQPPRSKDLVISLAVGPDWEGSVGQQTLARFAGTLRQFNVLADVVFLADLSNSTIALLDAATLLDASFKLFDAHGYENDVPPSLLRWHVMREFLEAHKALYAESWVLFADASSLSFQRDPFTLAESKKRDPPQLHAFFYPNGTAHGSYSLHAAAAQRCLPHQARALSSLPVSSSGVLLAAFAQALEHARAMEGAVASLASYGGRQCKSDQPLHDWVLQQTNHVRFHSHERGPVLSLAANDVAADARGRFVNGAGEVAHIVRHLGSMSAYGTPAPVRLPLPIVSLPHIEPLAAIIQSIRDAYLSAPPAARNQQTLRNYIDFAITVRTEAVARGGCRVLVFGLGHDSGFTVRANALPGSTTVFVESSLPWILAIEAGLTVQAGQSVVRVLPYNYTRTRVAKTDDLVSLGPSARHDTLMMRELPADILDEAWDVVLVDAPPGYSSGLPGRLQPLYTASVLARARQGDLRSRHIFVHDYQRQSETAGVAAFFAGSPATADANLLHITVRPR